MSPSPIPNLVDRRYRAPDDLRKLVDRVIREHIDHKHMGRVY